MNDNERRAAYESAERDLRYIVNEWTDGNGASYPCRASTFVRIEGWHDDDVARGIVESAAIAVNEELWPDVMFRVEVGDVHLTAESRDPDDRYTDAVVTLHVTDEEGR